MRIPDPIARFNRHVTNPIQRLWAGRLPGYGIIEHTGRRSGAAYRTPVTVFRTSDGFAVLLMYGRDRDWVKNLMAAGGGHIVHRGRRTPITEPTIVSGEAARDLLPRRAAFVSRRLGVDALVVHS